MSDLHLEEFRLAVEEIHGCEATFTATVRVVLGFRGFTTWEREVHTFALSGHAEADQVFVWSRSDGETPRFEAILARDGVTSAHAAVQAAIDRAAGIS